MLLLPDGTLASQLRVQDVVSYGVAGAAGIAITIILLPSLWNTTAHEIWPVCYEAMSTSSSVLLTVATQILVSVSVAESELKIGRGNVLRALLLVAAIRFLNSGLSHIVAVPTMQQRHVWYRFLLPMAHSALLVATFYEAWKRLSIAMLAEGAARAVI